MRIALVYETLFWMLEAAAAADEEYRFLRLRVFVCVGDCSTRVFWCSRLSRRIFREGRCGRGLRRNEECPCTDKKQHNAARELTYAGSPHHDTIVPYRPARFEAVVRQ